MLKVDKKYYNGSYPHEEIKVGHIVIFLRDYPNIFKKGDLTRVQKVYVKDVKPPVDYIIVEHPKYPKGWLISVSFIDKANEIQRKRYYHNLRMNQRAKQIGKET